MKQDYMNWIAELEWDYIVTIRKHYSWSKNSVQRTINKLGKSLIEEHNAIRAFMVGERDTDDPKSHHLHLILNIKDKDIDYIQSIADIHFNTKDKKHIERVNDSRAVGIYLNKFIDKDVVYEIY